MTWEEWDNRLRQKGFIKQIEIRSTHWTLYNYGWYFVSLEPWHYDMPGSDEPCPSEHRKQMLDFFAVIIRQSEAAKKIDITIRVPGFISYFRDVEPVLDAIVDPKLWSLCLNIDWARPFVEQALGT